MVKYSPENLRPEIIRLLDTLDGLKKESEEVHKEMNIARELIQPKSVGCGVFLAGFVVGFVLCMVGISGYDSRAYAGATIAAIVTVAGGVISILEKGNADDKKKAVCVPFKEKIADIEASPEETHQIIGLICEEYLKMS